MDKIDEVISEQIDLINKKISKHDFKTVCEFNLSEINKVKRSCEFLKKTKGVYLFEIQNKKLIEFNQWIIDFTLKFRGDENKYLQKWTPNIVQKRTKEHSGVKEWIPLYLGKSNNIANRIEKHISSVIGRPPSALKLIERGNLADEIFRIKYIEVNVKNYDVIVSEIEKALRNEINPISGK